MSEEVVRQIEIARLLPSATQPRQLFDAVEMRGLVESVRTHGVIQPLLVRQREDGGIEIVDGERRWRAAKEVGLPTAPAIFKAPPEHELLEIQLIANLQRDDLTPMEEAAGYQRLLALRDAEAKPVYTVEKIVHAVGKPRDRIYFRLKLLRLPPLAREHLARDESLASVCEVIGSLPTATMRERAAEEILKPILQSGPMTHKQALEHVRNHFMRSLAGAPFDQGDAELVPVKLDEETGERVAGGACTDCPMRTGNMPEGNVKRPDVCTNPSCFAAKTDAHWARVNAGATEQGKRFLSESETLDVMESDGSVRFESGYVDLSDRPDRGTVRDDVAKLPTWRRLLSELPKDGATVEIVIARDTRNRTHELVRQDDIMAAVNFAAEQAGEKSIFDRSQKPKPESRNDATRKAQAEEERREQKLQFEIKLQSMTALVDAIEKEGIGRDHFEKAMIEIALQHAGHDGRWFVAKRRGHDNEEGVVGLRLREPNQKWAFIVELLLGKAFKTLGTEDKAFRAFGKVYSLDLKAIERAVRKGDKPNESAPRKCHDCAESAVEGKSMCEKHLAINRDRVKKLRAEGKA